MARQSTDWSEVAFYVMGGLVIMVIFSIAPISKAIENWNRPCAEVQQQK